MFSNKNFEKLSRSTQYRVQKVLLSHSTCSDIEIDDSSDEASTASNIEDCFELSCDVVSENDDYADVEDNNGYIVENDDRENSCTANINDDNCSINESNNSNTTEFSSDNGEEETQSIDGSSVNDEFSEWNMSSEDNRSENSDSDDSSDDSQNESHFSTDHINDPIYPNAPLTLGESVLCILTFMIRHRVTKVLLADLLSLISLHCIKPNYCVKTLYYFKKFFKNIKSPITRHYFCSVCFSKLENERKHCHECKKKQEVSYFIQIPLVPQLFNLFKRPNFYNSLQGRFNRQKLNKQNLEDIWDGTVYQSFLKNNGLLSHPSNISFTWNTDGISLFKSSKFSLWPFYLTINELPFQIRTKKQNLLLAGIWFGEKPQPNLFLDSFQSEFKKIYQGVWCRTPDLNRRVKVQGITICGTCDLPAKASFLNMKGHTGIYGCCHCKIQSKYFNRRRIYPFKKNLQVRTTKESIEDGKKAFESNREVNGIKGPTVLTQIVQDVFDTTVVDIMHCVYLGVVKRLFSLWFESCYSNCIFSLHEHLQSIDVQIRSINPPAFVSRLTRSVNDHKYWKASEWKQWLLYYSIPLLSSIMADEYLEHHKLLVIAISYLSCTSVSKKMISVASTSIKIYVYQFKDLYGLTHMTCNLHSLQHLPDVVRKFGPLPMTSCFAYEDLNGGIRRLVQGTRYAQLQVCSALSVFNNIIELKSEALQYNNEVTQFCEKLEQFNLRRRKLVHIFDNFYVMGKLIKHNLSDLLQTAFAESNIHLEMTANVRIFTRLFIKDIVYDSDLYKRKKKTNSSTVIYNHSGRNNIGTIKKFVKICFCQRDAVCTVNCRFSRFFAIISKCISVRSIIPNALIDTIDLCIKSDEPPLAIDIRRLKTVCFYIKNNNEHEPNTFFIIRPINLTEID